MGKICPLSLTLHPIKNYKILPILQHKMYQTLYCIIKQSPLLCIKLIINNCNVTYILFIFIFPENHRNNSYNLHKVITIRTTTPVLPAQYRIARKLNYRISACKIIL